MAYIGRTTDGFGVRQRFLFTPDAGATSVSGTDANGATLTFSDSVYMDVFLNGVLLKAGTDYNTNTANTIAGLTATVANDEVTVLVYDIFTTADMVSATSGGTFTGNVTHSGDLTINGTTTLSGPVTFDSSAPFYTISSNSILRFRDSGIGINSSTDGQLDIDADTEVEITTTTVDLNGALDVSGASTLTGNVTLGGTLDINGGELILDADADTSITADTDDEIHVKIGGADDFKFKANTLEVQTGSNIDMNGTELILDADADTSITADTDDQVDIKVGGTDTIRIKPDELEIRGPHPSITITDNDDSNYGGIFYNNGSITIAADHGATGATASVNFATDSTQRMTINANGYMNNSYQPVLSLYGDTVRVAASGQNTDTDVSFSENFDNTNSYDTANKYFSAPQDGRYLINFFASVKSDSSYVMIKIKVGSTTEAVSYGEEPNDGLDWVARSCSALLQLSAGDAVRFQLTGGSSTASNIQILEGKYRGVNVFLVA